LPASHFRDALGVPEIRFSLLQRLFRLFALRDIAGNTYQAMGFAVRRVEKLSCRSQPTLGTV
jgi:hypothetical protein